MLYQVVRQQMRLLRQRAGPANVAFLQRRTCTGRVVVDLPDGLLLLGLERSSHELFQLVVDGTEPLLRFLALAGGFLRRQAGRNLRRGFARSTFANHNFPWSGVECWGGLAAFRGNARSAGFR